MEKRKPHFRLADIQSALGDAAMLNRTKTAENGAAELGFSNEDVAAVIRNLTGKDFYKSMTAIHDARSWQDVYRPVSGGQELYVKLTKDAQGNFLLISFKESES